MLGFVQEKGRDEGVAFAQQRRQFDGRDEGGTQQRIFQIEIEDLGRVGLEKSPRQGRFPGLAGADNKEGPVIPQFYGLHGTRHVTVRKQAPHEGVRLLRLYQPRIELQYPVMNVVAQHVSRLSWLMMTVNHD